MSERSVRAVTVLALLLACAVPLVAQDTPSVSDDRAAAVVQHSLEKLLAQLPKKTDVGLLVVDADSGAIWFARQPHRPLKPASVMKLFVTAAALQRFGPDFAYQTRLYTQNGELLVLGGGDPGLGDERIARRHHRPLHGEFDDWVRLLKQRGLSTLQTIALDDTIFDRQHRHPDWPEDQAQTWYQAPVGGLSFNDNCLDAGFTIAAGQVILDLRPELPADFLRNRLVVSTKHRPTATRALGQDVFEFRGPVTHDDRFKPISAARPTVFFGHALRQALAQRGVTLSGHVVRREITSSELADAQLLDVRTTPLCDVLWRCNTFSQNLFAECLLKSLAAYDADGSRGDTVGTWAGGVAVLRETLSELGVDLDGAVFRDGSGLSHDNRVTAQQIAQLLLRMRHHRYGHAFIESLAQPGEEGTLRRWTAPALRNRLRAKTGTINAVRSLAGYVERSDGTTLAFALLANGSAPRSFPRRVAEVLVEAAVSSQP